MIAPPRLMEITVSQTSSRGRGLNGSSIETLPLVILTISRFNRVKRDIDRTPEQDQQDNRSGRDPGEPQPGERSPDKPEENERDQEDDEEDEKNNGNNRERPDRLETVYRLSWFLSLNYGFRQTIAA